MSIAAVKLAKTAGVASSDEQLLRECLNGNEEAWSALVGKYKHLVFSIPVKYGLSRADACDIFQSVWLELLSQLPHLREPRALPKWLIQVAAHKCIHLRQGQKRFEDIGEESLETAATSSASQDIVDQVEREQLLRQAIWSSTPRCAQLIQLVFFESPARRYDEIARELGLATRSIGFIRGRCLDHLKQNLFSRGWR